MADVLDWIRNGLGWVSDQGRQFNKGIGNAIGNPIQSEGLRGNWNINQGHEYTQAIASVATLGAGPPGYVVDALQAGSAIGGAVLNPEQPTQKKTPDTEPLPTVYWQREQKEESTTTTPKSDPFASMMNMMMPMMLMSMMMPTIERVGRGKREDVDVVYT